MAVPGEDVPDPGLIQAALDNDPHLAETRSDIAAARHALDKLAEELRSRLGNDAPDLTPLERRLGEMAAALGAVAQPASAEAGPQPAANGGEPPAAAASTAPGDLNTRDQVVAALDKILVYYQRHEPASPIPLLLKRAKRLVPLDFLDLMEDLAPSSVKQLKELGGIDKKGSSAE